MLDAGVALSLANLLFLNVWVQLLDRKTEDFFLRTPAPPSLAIVTAIDVVLVGSLLYFSFRLGRRLTGFARKACELVLLGILLVPLNILRTRVLKLGASGLLHHGITILLAPAACVVAWVVVRHRQPSIRLARRLAILLLALFPLEVAHVAVVSSPTGSDRPLAARIQRSQSRHLRVVWVIFDEFDECLAFSGRPSSVALPELDRLRRESIFSTRARPPGPATIRSIPCLFTGKYVDEAEVVKPYDLSIRYRGEKGFHLWSEEPSVFKTAYSLGFNTGLAGWFHPYCRLFSFTACDWVPTSSVFAREDYAQHLSLVPSILLQLRLQTIEVPGLGFAFHGVETTPSRQIPSLRSRSRAHEIREYRDIHQAAMRQLRDQGLDLVFLHWPMPHPLYFFDRRTGDFTTGDGANYFDALALVDRTVGDIRSTLQQEGVWDETALLISSDHPLRADEARVLGAWSQEEEGVLGKEKCSYIPFLLKMPGQRRAIQYDGDLGALVSGDLLLAILKGEVKSPEAAIQWLRTHPR